MKVAITGHQDLGDNNTITWVESEIELLLKNFKIKEAYSCLAIGADQLFADVVLRNHIPLIAVIPCYNYEITFDNGNLVHYKLLLSKAFKKIQVQHNQPTEKAFFEAGKIVADNCDMLIAVWNNLPAEGLGGTADVVKYARDNKKKGIHLNPLTKAINKI